MLINRFLGHTLFDIAASLLGIAALTYLWIGNSDLFVEIMDTNLWLVKKACSLLDPAYAKKAESALRGALNADRSLLLVEAAIASKMILRVVLLILRIVGRALTGSLSNVQTQTVSR